MDRIKITCYNISLYLKTILSIKWKILWVIADKSEDRIERSQQDGKRSERIYCGLTKFQQFQISRQKNNDMITNQTIKLKPEQI